MWDFNYLKTFYLKDKNKIDLDQISENNVN